MEGLLKCDVTLRCLTSLGKSITRLPGYGSLVRLTVVDDGSDPEHVGAWASVLLRQGIEATWMRVDRLAGQSSFGVAIAAASSTNSSLVYFVEDDYLHFPEAITVLMQGFAVLRSTVPDGQFAMTTYDCPDRYTRPPYQSTIWFAGGRYWRTVRHTTGTFAITGGLLQKYWAMYSKFADYGRDSSVSEDTTINRVYQCVPCFSPIPTLAIHLQYAETLPLLLPEGGWRGLWDSMA